MSDDEGPEQLALVPSSSAVAPRASTTSQRQQIAAAGAVARVIVDSGLAHLDRYFDYLVPASLDDAVHSGCRVKVRFAGRLVDGFVVERVDSSTHSGRLAVLAKVVSPEPVLTPEVLRVARAVADRYAGTLGDVLRLAIPPRHARAEKAARPKPPGPLPPGSDTDWRIYQGAPAYLSALRDGASPRAWWSAVPGHDPARAVAEAVLAVLESGRGALVCVPDARDLAHWSEVFTQVLGERRHVVLAASADPADRYRSFMAVVRGDITVVLGTRSAAFAPVADLGLVVLWDDGDDLYAEPRAPYPHAREVLLLRAVEQHTALLMGGYARTAEGQSLVENGWCAELVADRPTRRRAWPRVQVTDGAVAGSAPARLPHEVFAAIRAADGPVLVQVPRRGYRESLSCQECRAPARCDVCTGPLGQTAAAGPVACRWCGDAPSPWRCATCGGARLRAPVVGALRTAEEFAKAFSTRQVVTSGGDTVLDSVPEGPLLVLATPGAEPRVDRGYRVVVLLDTWLMLGRDDVRVDEESRRRWFNALALASPGASAIAVGDAANLQDVVRADPVGFAARELAARTETRLPPAVRLGVVEGPDDVLDELAAMPWTQHTEVLGPAPANPHDVDAGSRLILRAPRREGAALAALLKSVAGDRSAAKLSPLRIRVDPARF